MCYKKIELMDVPGFAGAMSKFNNEDIKKVTVAALETAPLQFWIMPASTRSNLHNSSEHEIGEIIERGNLSRVISIGGKAYHTLRVLKYAEALIETDRKAVVNRWTRQLIKTVPGNEYSDREEDIIRAACLLHDIYSGGTNDEYNPKMRGMDKFHPHYHRTELDEVLSELNPTEKELLLMAVENHMWKYDEFKSPVSFHHMDYMDTAREAYEFARKYRVIKVVELSDYLAAQNI